MSDPSRDPKLQISEAIRELRAAAGALRENVVQTVMRRNRLQDEAAKLERLIADIETKAALAEKINNTALAEELRAERKNREAELERLRAIATQAEAEAESAKIQLPEEEARLLQQVNDLKGQLARVTGAQVEQNAPGGMGTEADALWERAGEKLRNLQNEASARAEVAGGRSGAAPTPHPTLTPEQSAEQMLTALENRLGMAPAAEALSMPSPTHFLELDKPPASSETGSDAPPSEDVEARYSAPEEKPENPAKTTEAINQGGNNPAPTPADPEKQSNDSRESMTPATFANIVTKVKGETARMEPTSRVRVAGIGTGGIFRGAHLPAYPDIPQAQMVAFCDPDPQAQKLVRERYGSLVNAKIEQAKERKDTATVERLERDREAIQIFDDISEVIAKVKPDLVDICTQPFLHTPLSIQALEAGINVMCEKPISRSWLETLRLIETVARTGKFYQHNENWLWDPDYYTAKKLVEAGAIGEPILMFLATAHGGPEGNPKFWNSDFGGGGALLDNGIHAIGAAWYVSGFDKKPTHVKAAQPFGMSIRMPNRIIDGRFQQVQVDDDAHILIRFENADTGAWTTAHVEGSWSHRDSPDTVILGTTGKIEFVSDEKGRYAIVKDAYDREARRIDTSGPTWQHWPSSFYGEILNMVECVRNGVPSISTAQFGADCSAVVGASYLSERDGRRAVSVEEYKAFARDIASRYPNDPVGANNALIEAQLAAVRKK
jgi:predicted dehydrogenase/phage shock protein A